MPEWDNQKALTIFQSMLTDDEQQDRRRVRGQRRPRQRGDLGAQVGRPQADPGHAARTRRRRDPEHPARLAVHDRLQADQGGGRRGRDGGRRRSCTGEADQARQRQDHERTASEPTSPSVLARPRSPITKNNWKTLSSRTASCKRRTSAPASTRSTAELTATDERRWRHGRLGSRWPMTPAPAAVDQQRRPTRSR